MVKLPKVGKGKKAKTMSNEDVVAKFLHEKKIAVDYQKRRHKYWQEIYELYRNIVRINRLTQRQGINMPLMKETIKTLHAKIGDEPYVDFKSKSGDANKEILINSLFRQKMDYCSFNLLDKVDKKQELLYGRSHMGLTLHDGEITPDVVDIYDLLIDPTAKPTDIESARFVIRTNVVRPLNEVKHDKKYAKQARNSISATQMASQTKDQIKARTQRLQAIGVEDASKIEGYDKIVMLDEYFTNLWDGEKNEFVRYYCVIGDDNTLLRAEPMIDAFGVEFYPYEGWASDLEASDYWSDGVGDLILTPNKTINIWISQHMENRTLRSFGMNFYDATIDGFTPQTYNPRPGGWYPVPGSPKDVMQRVDVPELSGSLNDIQFVVNFAEKASATGAITKGAVEDVKRTLGEIEIAVANANQITNSSEDYYNTSRKRLMEKWYAMLEANADTVKLYKKNTDGVYKSKDAKPEDYIDDEGYIIEVANTASITNEKTNELQNLYGFKQSFLPNNKTLDKLIQRRYASFLNLDPQEIQEIQDEEEQNAEQALQGQIQGIQQPQAQSPQQLATQVIPPGNQ